MTSQWGLSPICQTGTPAETSNTIKPGKEDIQWNLRWNIPLEWVSYFVPLGERELLSLQWNPIVLLQARPVEMNYAWNETGTTEGGQGEGGVLVWHITSPGHLLIPDSAASASKHVCYVQPGQVPKAANLPFLKAKARWAHSVLLLVQSFAIIFVPSIGQQNIIA